MIEKHLFRKLAARNTETEPIMLDILISLKDIQGLAQIKRKDPLWGERDRYLQARWDSPFDLDSQPSPRHTFQAIRHSQTPTVSTRRKISIFESLVSWNSMNPLKFLVVAKYFQFFIKNFNNFNFEVKILSAPSHILSAPPHILSPIFDQNESFFLSEERKKFKK